MYKQLPEEIIEAICYEIGRNDLDCADNYRAYRLHDGFMFDDFEKAALDGCCGSFEVHYTDKKGDKWMIGCNYGH